MPTFRLLVRGENFDLGSPLLMGFYTTLHVEASTAEDAESEGLAKIKSNPRLKNARARSGDLQPRVWFDEIEELAAPIPPQPELGFAWFEMA